MVGLVIMVVAFLIIKTIAEFTGISSITQFTIPK